jgi:hypothetical protein
MTIQLRLMLRSTLNCHTMANNLPKDMMPSVFYLLPSAFCVVPLLLTACTYLNCPA